MQSASHYRNAAGRARRLSRAMGNVDDVKTLEMIARDYDDIATDLDNGAIEIVHPERMPQLQHPCDD